MYEDKPIIEPIRPKKLGTILRKGGEWNSDHTQCDPHDTIEGYVLEVTHHMLQEREEYLHKENRKLMDQVHYLKNIKVSDDVDEETKDYLNLLTDIKLLNKLARRMDKRSRVTKDPDVSVRCANACAICLGKKLLLMQALHHKK